MKNQWLTSIRSVVFFIVIISGFLFSTNSFGQNESGHMTTLWQLDYEPSAWQVSKLSKLKYDIAFKKHTGTFMQSVDWRLLKAQCFQESAFNEEAVSPVGAKGLCQFMPGTWSEELERANISGHPFNYDLNIQIAAQYMARLRGQWTSPRPEPDRHSLALASYNAGLGNLLNAQRKCDNPNLYDQIMICLPCVTGEHSRETTQYVYRIWAFYSELIRSDNY